MSETLLHGGRPGAMAEQRAAGCGNFLSHALEGSPAPDHPLLWLHKPFASYVGEAYETLSLRELESLARHYASLYHRLGVESRDCVAVYLDEGAGSMVHYLALTSLGAIPVLVNGAMKPEIAIRFIGRIGVKAVYTDTRRHAAISADADESCGLLITDAIAAGAEGGGRITACHPSILTATRLKIRY